ncbi:MAG: glycosyltransferase family 39 protein [Anaerolineae bacterium]|jgi:hypothetical protein|nr:glycosyltransferase family 39 protein [Anaerolineae bacterium]MDH7472445.1 glycosyltransferase family 39 protein [Anaerolineae bacterium]
MKQRIDLRWMLAVGFVIGWLFAAYAVFYLVQKPFDQNFATATGNAVLDALFSPVILLLGAALGRRLIRLLGASLASPGEELILTTSLGLGLLSFLVLILGLVGLLYKWVFYGLSAVLFLALFSDATAVCRTAWTCRPAIRPPRPLFIYLAITLGLAFLVALTPPVDWDGLFYHLTGPRLYVEQHRIAPGIDIPHLNFPSLMEMLYLYGMLLKGDVTAKLMHFWYALLLTGLVYLLARRHLFPRAAWPSVAIFASMPMIPVLAGWAYNDIALAFYQLAALYTLCNWFTDRRRQWLILSAAMCGLAMGLKYTSFVCPLTLVVLIVWRQAIRERARAGVIFRSLLLFSVVALLVASPWYIKNFFFTGNPFYPFAYEVFGGRFWDEFRAAWYARAGTGIGLNPLKLLALPWTLTLGIRDMNYYDGRMGPLFLALLPSLLVYWLYRPRREGPPRSAAVSYLLVFALAQYLAWTWGVIASRSLFQSRLLLPCFVALAPALAVALDSLRALDRSAFSLHRFVWMTIAIVLALNVVYQGLDFLRIDPLPYLAGRESRDEFLTRNLGQHYAAMQDINENLPAGAKILFLWEPRSYYCQRQAQPDAILETWKHLVYKYDSVDAIARHLADEGYTHVLLHQKGLEFVLEAGMDPITEEDVRLWENLASDYLTVVHREDEGYVLYALGGGSGP